MEWYSNLDLSILIVDSEIHAETAGGIALRQVIEILGDLDFRVIEALTVEDALSIYRSVYPDIACVLLDWDLQPESAASAGPVEMIRTIRKRNRDLPIFLFTSKLAVNEIPLEVIRSIDGYFWKLDNTPRFIAGRIEDVTGDYLDKLLPAFFGELVRYTQEYKYAWHTPGHTGGIAFLKSPVGKLFFRFYGENTLRSDLSVSVPELGSLLEHTGVVGAAESDAARIFGADRTYFLTNGTSTSNKVVFSGCVQPGDIVLVDRNCHKSVMYAIIMTGAIPVYLIPTRNPYGIIGPIHAAEFDPAVIQKKCADHPLIADAGRTPRLAVVTNSTYDGLCYDVEAIIEKLTGTVGVLLFDDTKKPGLNIHCGWRLSRTFEGIADCLPINCTGFEFSDTVTRFDDRCDYVHTPEWERQAIKGCVKKRNQSFQHHTRSATSSATPAKIPSNPGE